MTASDREQIMEDAGRNPHIVSDFDAELKGLEDSIQEMGRLASRQLVSALEVLRTGNSELVQEVVEADARIDSTELSVTQMAVRILALRQPMALDLRQTVAALRLGGVIERVGDLAKNLARRAPGVDMPADTPVIQSLLRLGRDTDALLNRALKAYASRDIELAESVRNGDVAIDNDFKRLFDEVVVEMTQHTSSAESCALLITMAKNVERIGDHATFIAEMAYFMVNGTPPEAKRPKGDPWGLPEESDDD